MNNLEKQLKMTDTSIFQDKLVTPADQDLVGNLGSTFHLWNLLRKFVLEKYPGGKEEWNYPGKKYGWSFRIELRNEEIVPGIKKLVLIKLAN